MVNGFWSVDLSENLSVSSGSFVIGQKWCKVSEISFTKLEFDLAATSFYAVIVIGGFLLAFFPDSFDDDDDQDGGGTMSPVYEPAYISSAP